MAVVALTEPKRLALGAATPLPNALSSASAIGCDGTRRPTVGAPPVTASSTLGPRRAISVSGPGQNRAASARAASDSSAVHAGSSSADARCTITGCEVGRPLAA